MLKIIYGAFEEETNTFSPYICRRDRFESLCCLEGDEILQYMRHKKDSASGILETLEKEEVEIIPTMAMLAQSSGRVDQSVCDEYVSKVIEVIQKNYPVDGIVMAFHGATCLTEEDDGLGYILSRLRTAVGPKAVISCATDLHANITPLSIQSADIIVGYHTYPHVDIYETGVRAAELALKAMKSSKRPYMAYVKLPLILPSNCCDTSRKELVELSEFSDGIQNNGKILDYTIFYLQPWLDVHDCGASIVTISWDKDEAEKAAIDIARRLFGLRKVLQSELIDINTVFDFVRNNDSGKIVVVSDAGDNTSGGAAGDSTFVLNILLTKYPDIKAALFVVDPEAPFDALKVGVGNIGKFTVGGKLHPQMHKPITIEAKVLKAFEYKVLETIGPYTGYEVNFGQTAMLRTGNVDVIACEVPQIDFSPTQFTGIGIDFKDYDCVICKSTIAYRAWFRNVTDLFFSADTYGSTCGDVRNLTFQKITRPMWPFDQMDDYSIEHADFGYRYET